METVHSLLTVPCQPVRYVNYTSEFNENHYTIVGLFYLVSNEQVNGSVIRLKACKYIIPINSSKHISHDH